MKVKVLVSVAALVLLGGPLAAPAHAVNDQQLRYMSDVDQHGGLSADQSYAPGGQTLGDAVCADLHKGNAAANEVIGVANDVTPLRGSMAKAEVAVYWAITDLCPGPDQPAPRPLARRPVAAGPMTQDQATE